MAERDYYENINLIYIRQLFADEKGIDTLCNILKNPQYPTYVLERILNEINLDYIEELSMDKAHNVRKIYRDQYKNYLEKYVIIRAYAVKNPNCTIQLLEQIMSETEDSVAEKQSKKGLYNHPDKKYNRTVKNFNSIRAALAKNPNCTNDLLERLSKINDANIKLAVASNTACPDYLLEELSNINNYTIKCAVASNLNATEPILEKLSDGENYVKCSVAMNPNCPKHILEKLSCDKSYTVRGSVAKNINCPVSILRKLSWDIEHYVRSAVASNPNCPLYIVWYHAKYESFADVKSRINEVINSDNCPRGFITLIAELGEIALTLNKQTISKIKEHVKTSDATRASDIKEFLYDVFGPEEYPSNSLDIDFLSNNIDYVITDNHEDQTDYAKELNNRGAKITYSCIYPNYVEEKLDSFGSDEVAYGEFFKTKIKYADAQALKELYDLKLLRRTGKEYRILGNFGKTKYYKEYEFNKSKFVKSNNDWYYVEPIYWVYDRNSKKFICKNDLFSVGPILENKKKMLDKYFRQDIKSDYVKTNKEELIEANAREVKLENEQKNQDTFKKIKEIDKKEQEKKKQRQEIMKQLNDEEYQLLVRFAEIQESKKHIYAEDETTYETGKMSYNLKKVVTKVEDHFEFGEEYIKYLKYIDLSPIHELANLKVSGIDFRGTNIKINPQTVYKKDLSYAAFDDENISFKSFEGCILDGTDLSDDMNSFGFDKAASTNSDTKLPERNKEQKLYSI